jgi:predicted methyltransferase
MLDVKIFWLTIYKVLKRSDVGIETSGVVNFNNYRNEEWEKEGLQDKIVTAKKEMQEIMNKYNIKW